MPYIEGEASRVGSGGIGSCEPNPALRDPDTLVESGAMRTRSEASAWLLQSGIAANKEYLDEIRRIGEEIARLRQDVQRLTEAHIGRTAAAQEDAGTNPEEQAGERPRSE